MCIIIQNINGTFDLLNNDDNSQITNEGFTNIRFENELFIAEKEGKIFVLSKDGNTNIISNCDSISFSLNNSFIIYEVDNLFGIYNLNGSSLNPICSIVSEFEFLNEDGSTSFIIGIMHYQTIWNSKIGMYKELFSSLAYIGHGLIKFTRLSKGRRIVGLMNQVGEIMIEKKSSQIFEFPDIRRIIFEERKQAKIYDFNLNLINDGFSEIHGFIGNVSIAIKQEQFGLIDINGDWIGGYENLDNDIRWWNYYDSPFKEGFVLIKKNNLYGLVNRSEKLHFKPIAQNLLIFHLGYAPVQIENGNWGIIDTNLNWVVEPTLLEMKFCFESYNDVEDYITSIGLPFIAKSPKTKKFGLISYDGKWICEPKYDQINANDFYFLPHKYLFYLKFEQGEYKGVINIHGKEIFKEKIEWRKFDDFDEFEFELEEFRFDLNSNYMKLQLPKNYIYFLVKKDHQDAYYDANGNYFSGNPKITEH